MKEKVILTVVATLVAAVAQDAWLTSTIRANWMIKRQIKSMQAASQLLRTTK
jgi:hypothetical protein